MSNETMVPVYEADSQAEAGIIEGILKKGGIACSIKPSGAAGGSLHIVVQSADSAKAEAIILDYESPDDQYK